MKRLMEALLLALSIIGLAQSSVIYENGAATLVTTPTTNVVNEASAFTYSIGSGLPGSDNSIAYCMSSLAFDNPTSGLDFQLRGQGGPPITFTLTVGSTLTINLLKVSYFVYSTTQIIFPASEGNHLFNLYNVVDDLGSFDLSNSPGTIRTRTVTPAYVDSNAYFYHKRKVYAFITGMTATTVGASSDIEVKVDGQYSANLNNQWRPKYTITVGENTQLAAIMINIFLADEWALQFEKQYTVLKREFVQEEGVTVGDIPYGDISESIMLIGINSIATLDPGAGEEFRFEYEADLVTPKVNLNSAFGYNRFVTMEMVSFSCSAGQYENFETMLCETSRFGCPGLETLSFNILNPAVKVIIHKSNKYFVTLTGSELLFYQYDGVSMFIQFYTLSNYGSDNFINDFDISQDFSKVVIVGSSLFETYMWNGTHYLLSYSHPMIDYEQSGPYSLKTCSISDDGKVVTANGPFLNSRQHTFILFFNEALGEYQFKTDLPQQALIQKYQQSNNILILVGQNLLTLSAESSSPSLLNITSLQKLQFTYPNKFAFSGDGLVFAARYDQYTYSSDQCLVIYHYESVSHTFVEFQTICPKYINYNYKFDLNEDGTTLGLWIYNIYRSKTLVYRRASTADLFEFSQLLGIYQSGDGLSQFIGVSPDGQMIISTGQNPQIFYCSDMISEYTIPIQSAMYSSGNTQTTQETADATVDATVAESTSSTSGPLQSAILAVVIIVAILLVVILVVLLCKPKPPNNSESKSYDHLNQKNQTKVHDEMQPVGDESPNKQFKSMNNLNDSSPVLRKRKRRRDQEIVNQDKLIDIEPIE